MMFVVFIFYKRLFDHQFNEVLKIIKQIKKIQCKNQVNFLNSMQLSQIGIMIQQTQIQLKNKLQYNIFNQDYASTIQCLEKLIQIDPQDRLLYQAKAIALFNQKKYQQALKNAKISIEKGQKSIDLYNIMIKCHLEINQIQLAIEMIKKCISQNPALRQFLALKQAIEKISNQEKYQLPEREARILDQMKKWLYSKGGKYDKVKVINFNQDYRGAIATKSIKKDEIIIFIPKTELITLELAKQNPIAKQLTQKNVELLSPKHSIISLFLLEERVSSISKFKPYLDILPNDHSCFPINYSTQELTELIGSTFLIQIKEKVIDLKKDYDAICEGSSDFQNKYTFKDFCWARMMVGSRVFGVVIDGVKTQILAPFADMLNHKVPKQTVWNYWQERGGFFIQSLKDIEIGQQLFDSYGKKCNSRFLLNYGFVMDRNDRNQICIKVDLEQKDPALSKKYQMLKVGSNLNLTKIFKITKMTQENAFYELMGYLRFKNIQSIETLNLLEKISMTSQSNHPYNPSRSPPTTMEVEIKAWADLRRYCQIALAEYPTTLQQDQKRLKSDKNLTLNLKNILTLKIGEKEIYQHYQEAASEVIQILLRGYNQAYQIARKNSDKDYCRYIVKILNLMPHQKNDFLRKKLKEQVPELAVEEELTQKIQNDDVICQEY